MQRYELIEGSASKFWEVDVSGVDLTVRFGRIGTAGQSKTKTFADAAAAIKERDKLIKEKTGKGYGEVGVAAGATLAPAPSAPAAPARPAATTAPAEIPITAPEADPVVVAAAAAPAPVAPFTAHPQLIWPTEGFQWPEEWNDELPIVRGLHAPELQFNRSILSNIPSLSDERSSYTKDQFTQLAVASGRAWTLWQKAESKLKLTRDNLSRPDFEFWLEAIGQCVHFYGRRSECSWLTRSGIALHGLAFMLEVVLELSDLAQDHAGIHNFASEPLTLLRQSIACADESEYAAALETATRLRERNEGLATLCASLFPHMEAWATEIAHCGDTVRAAKVMACSMPPDAMLACLKLTAYQGYFYTLKPALCLHLRQHGEKAFESLTYLLRHAQNRDAIELALDFITRVRVPQLIPTLVERVEDKEVRAFLDKLAEAYPAAVLKTAIERSLATRSRTVEGWTVRLALRKHTALPAALDALGAGERERFEALLAQLNQSEAPVDALPALLHEPPWLMKKRPGALPTLEVQPLACTFSHGMTEAEVAEHAAYEGSGRFTRTDKGGKSKESNALAEMGIDPAALTRVLAAEPLRPEDMKLPHYFYGAKAEYLMAFEPKVALSLWNSYPGQHWERYYSRHRMTLHLLALHGEAAIPGLARLVQADPEDGLAVALHIDSQALVPTALHALRKHKKAKPAAIAWIKAHPATTLKVALPLAFGSGKAALDDARHGLRWMVANGFEAEARAIAAAYGNGMPAALQALLDADPLLVLPARMPKLPTFFVAASFRRPALRDGRGALPTAAVEHLGSMLAISTLDAPYPGLQVVKDLCTPASLAEFAWDLFEAWMAGGGASKENWAFAALGLLGDDTTAHRLAPKIREWPGEGSHQRAVTGLDLLATMGSDVALMHLNGIANKVKFKALQDRAKEKIAAVAEARGFTTDELADRLVPDLGLDADGTLRLDFGPRQFTVTFDEALKPIVKDAQGTRLKDLPKAIKSDDAALAEAATEQYKLLKKNAKTAASLQIARFELAMVGQRRWTADEFQRFFLNHPLMRHLAARVAWGVYVDGALTRGFRVAEDWTLADEHDEHTELPNDATVGIAHVLEMPQALQAAMGQVFADYEIMQPFKQLGRETFELTDAEKAGSEISRFKDKVVATPSLMGLIGRGWERCAAEDGGWVGAFEKRMGGTLVAELHMDPGTIIGEMNYEPRQKIPTITLRRAGTWDKDGLVKYAELGPVLASELLRDVELIAPIS
jgi:predicted DNA-binding WGR domain protein